MNPYAGNGGDLLKHMILSTVLDDADVDGYVESHGGLPFNDLSLPGFRYPKPIQPITVRRLGGPWVSDFLAGPGTADDPYTRVLRHGAYPPGIQPIGADGTWYPGSIGLVHLLRPNVANMVIRDNDTGVSRQIRELFPSARVVASGGPMPPEPFGRELLGSIGASGSPVVFIDPFHLADPAAQNSGAFRDAAHSRRLLCLLASLPSEPLTLAWYGIGRTKGSMSTPRQVVELLGTLSGIVAAGGGARKPLLMEMRWDNGGAAVLAGAGMLLLNAGETLVNRVGGAVERLVQGLRPFYPAVTWRTYGPLEISEPRPPVDSMRSQARTNRPDLVAAPAAAELVAAAVPLLVQGASSREMPDYVSHADWGSNVKKRQVASAVLERTPSPHYVVTSLCPADAGCVEAGRLRQALGVAAPHGTALLGFDLPIGVPEAYARSCELGSFLTLIDSLGTVPWEWITSVAATAADISLYRPFYPRRPGGTSRAQLSDALGIPLDRLRRRCEGTDAETMFWTLGGKQVGKAALSGWALLHAARRTNPAPRIWPFEGSLESLLADHSTVVVETYPREFYRWVKPKPGPSHDPLAKWSKTRQADRLRWVESLFGWSSRLQVEWDPVIASRIASGFDPGINGEDEFDAVIGLLGMIAVAQGSMPSGEPRDDPAVTSVEGWILGRSQSTASDARG